MLNCTFMALAIWTMAPAAGDTGGDRFVVHEWGTFTSFSGSDGVILEYRPTIGADLPDFVLDRPTWFDRQVEAQAGTKQVSAHQHHWPQGRVSGLVGVWPGGVVCARRGRGVR